MPKSRLPHVVVEKSRHGRVKYFFRIGHGPRIRLPDDYSTAQASDFMQAYRSALAGTPPPLPKARSRHAQNTLGWLFDQYQQSAKFKSLSEGTQRARANLIKGIVSKSGKAQLRDITERAVRQGRERRSATPEAANNFLKTMKSAFAWGIDSGLLDGIIETDPTANVKKITTKTEGFHTWTVDEIEAYESTHDIGTTARLALDLLIYTGLRRGDVVKVGRQHVKDGVLNYKTGKNGEWVHLPILPALQNSIDASPTNDLTFLQTEKGKPFSSAASFGNWFAKRCLEAGVEKGRAHGLRKAGAVLAAERGATTSQLMALFGWTTEDMATLYTKRASRSKLSATAIDLLDRSENKKSRT
ncbi:integrase family protein [Roseibium sp. TrichSKD4]|uniref:tyrosine-type recombinase/integrase n=1 Tax=Roseibium sp. TrichSKD4 TaxID=744980 RepID=UPI0001E56400|nr:site-specific integrase [Roseibium sp. TrichSKD4]EFO33950.1 integrase family protein [Roseibium sp. TrichSKD4]